MFHVEVRQFPHQARVFNLSREELRDRIVSRWVSGHPVEIQDRTWDPARGKLAVYEARELAGDEIGMGRGWATVTREGHDVTDRLLGEARDAVRAPPALDELKAEILRRADEMPLKLGVVLDMAAGLRSDLSATERVDLATRAVLELLQDGRLELSRSG